MYDTIFYLYCNFFHLKTFFKNIGNSIEDYDIGSETPIDDFLDFYKYYDVCMIKYEKLFKRIDNIQLDSDNALPIKKINENEEKNFQYFSNNFNYDDIKIECVKHQNNIFNTTPITNFKIVKAFSLTLKYIFEIHKQFPDLTYLINNFIMFGNENVFIHWSYAIIYPELINNNILLQESFLNNKNDKSDNLINLQEIEQKKLIVFSTPVYAMQTYNCLLSAFKEFKSKYKNIPLSYQDDDTNEQLLISLEIKMYFNNLALLLNKKFILFFTAIEFNNFFTIKSIEKQEILFTSHNNNNVDLLKPFHQLYISYVENKNVDSQKNDIKQLNNFLYKIFFTLDSVQNLCVFIDNVSRSKIMRRTVKSNLDNVVNSISYYIGYKTIPVDYLNLKLIWQYIIKIKNLNIKTHKNIADVCDFLSKKFINKYNKEYTFNSYILYLKVTNNNNDNYSNIENLLLNYKIIDVNSIAIQWGKIKKIQNINYQRVFDKKKTITYINDKKKYCSTFIVVEYLTDFNIYFGLDNSSNKIQDYFQKMINKNINKSKLLTTIPFMYIEQHNIDKLSEFKRISLTTWYHNKYGIIEFDNYRIWTLHEFTKTVENIKNILSIENNIKKKFIYNNFKTLKYLKNDLEIFFNLQIIDMCSIITNDILELQKYTFFINESTDNLHCYIIKSSYDHYDKNINSHVLKNFTQKIRFNDDLKLTNKIPILNYINLFINQNSI